MLSSSKITFSEALPDDRQLSAIWGGVFFHPIFVQCGSKYLGLDGSARSIVHEGNIIGFSNIMFRKRVGIRVSTIPLMFQYFGPVFLDSVLERNFIKPVIDHYDEEYDYVYLSFNPEFNSIDRLSRDWSIHRSATLAVTESELNTWGNNFRDDVKNKINKATREKVLIRKSDSLNEDLWGLSFSRKNIKPPIKPSDLRLWCTELINNSLLRIYTATLEGREVAFRAQLIYGRFAYDWIAGSNPEYHHLGINQLLMAEIGSEFARTGVTVWDLVDGSIKGIAEFKKSFGALEYYHWHAFKAIGVKGKLFGALRKIKNA